MTDPGTSNRVSGDGIEVGQWWTHDRSGRTYYLRRVTDTTIEVESDDWNFTLWERRAFPAYFTQHIIYLALRCPKCHLAFEGQEGQTEATLAAECGTGHHADTDDGCPIDHEDEEWSAAALAEHRKGDARE